MGASPKWTIAELEEKYPLRTPPVAPNSADIPPASGVGQSPFVTRFAPSPTGYMHIGGLYQMLINYKLARQSGGVFMLRIEDTDGAREVSGAVELIMGTQSKFGLFANETPIYNHTNNSWQDKGAYGPYIQSKRKDIYHSVVAELLARGDAYPCFLTADEMSEIRERQASAGFPTGIYGQWAKWRDATEAEISAQLEAGRVPSIRLYSRGDPSKRIFCRDVVRGSISFPENNMDEVIIKSSDGLPTYHFAHLCDDHFMRTTHVVRGEEWLPSFPLHIQMFNMMGWTPPAYVHTSTIDKIDDESGKQRKISKRKDPEANVEYFVKEGYPAESVLDYLLNIISSSYEGERAKNSNLHWYEHPINIKKIPTSGALFDFAKLNWWAREDIATLSVDDLTARVVGWAKEYNVQSSEFRVQSSDDIEYLKRILSIERDNPKRVRKDFVTWKQTLSEVSYFFESVECRVESVDKSVLNEFLKSFDINDDKDAWWNKIVKIAVDNGSKNGDVAMALRVALTGRTNTPDLYSIMQVMGVDMVKQRVENVVNGI